MANLVLNGRSIDNVDDIAENFVEEDVLREFQSGSLAAWLEEYGYEDELAGVRSIKPTASNIRILSGIIDALNLDDEVIAQANARREEQQRKDEAVQKAREEQLRKEEERKRREREEQQRREHEERQKKEKEERQRREREEQQRREREMQQKKEEEERRRREQVELDRKERERRQKIAEIERQRTVREEQLSTEEQIVDLLGGIDFSKVSRIKGTW